MSFIPFALLIFLMIKNINIFLQDPKDTPPPVRVETREERLERRRRERAEQVAYKLEQEIAVWDPAGISNVTADPFKTLFVARIVCIIILSKYNNETIDSRIHFCVYLFLLTSYTISFFYRIMTPQNLN